MTRTPERSRRHILRLGFRRFRMPEGSSLAELAFVLPILSLFLVGVLEFGRVYFAGIEATSAARAGVAYGGQTLGTASDTSRMQTAAINDAGDNISGTMTAIASYYCKCSDGTAVSCAIAATACISPAHPLEFIQVSTQATVDPLFHVPGLPTTYTVKGFAVMRVQ